MLEPPSMHSWVVIGPDGESLLPTYDAHRSSCHYNVNTDGEPAAPSDVYNMDTHTRY